MDILKNIFGGGSPDTFDERSQQYQRGYQRGEGGFDDLDDDEVRDRYGRTLQYAPPDVLAQAHEGAFGRLPAQARQRMVEGFRQAHDDPQQAFRYDGFTGGQEDYAPRQMSQMFGQAQRQQPDLLQQMLGSGGALSNPLAKAAMAAVAAIAAQKLTGGRRGG